MSHEPLARFVGSKNVRLQMSRFKQLCDTIARKGNGPGEAMSGRSPARHLRLWRMTDG
jgi:hypothetical protein